MKQSTQTVQLLLHILVALLLLDRFDCKLLSHSLINLIDIRPLIRVLDISVCCIHLFLPSSTWPILKNCLCSHVSSIIHIASRLGVVQIWMLMPYSTFICSFLLASVPAYLSLLLEEIFACIVSKFKRSKNRSLGASSHTGSLGSLLLEKKFFLFKCNYCKVSPHFLHCSDHIA